MPQRVLERKICKVRKEEVVHEAVTNMQWLAFAPLMLFPSFPER